MARKTIAQTLEEQRVLIYNGSKPQIAPLLADYGIDEERLAQGKELHQQVETLCNTQKEEQQDESRAYDIFHEKKIECKEVSKHILSLVKMASRADKDLQNRLGLFTPREKTIEEWILQTLQFYNRLLNETAFLSTISRFKITEKLIENEKARLEGLKSLRNEAMSEKGQAQEATRLRNKKMEELEDFCYELKTVSKIALANQPQLLEMQGILVR